MKIKDIKIRVKTILRKKLSPTAIFLIKKLFLRNKFDEVDLIYSTLSKKIISKIMIDVGAHYGESFSPFLHDGWKVYAFEPDSRNMKELQIISRDNDRLNLDNRGCSNKTESNINFYSSDVSSGISSMSAFDSSHKETNKIDTVTLKDFIKDKQISNVGFLKIDTEGHDLFVLQGLPWDKIKPEIIVAEFEDKKSLSLGYTYHDMAKILIENGYIVYISEWFPIQRYGAKHVWRSMSGYPYQLKDANGWGNIIATTNSDFAKQLEKSVDVNS